MNGAMIENAPASAPWFRLMGFRELRLLLVILVFGVAVTWYDVGFSKPATINIILLWLACYAIMACGMTVLLVSGGFDLSVGSVAALSAMVSAVLMKAESTQMGWIPAILCGLLTGALIGCANGVMVAKLGINPFITTLGSMLLARGLTLVISGGVSRSGFDPQFTNLLGNGQIPKTNVQIPIVISLVLVILFDILLRKSRFFRQNYYIGGNEQAAWLSGIQVNRIKIFNYALSGTLAALAGLVFMARFDAIQPNELEGDELKVITAVILGGASLSGGRGTVLGAFLGCVLLAMIRPAINFLGIDDHWEKFIIGAILIFAVLMDRIGRR